MSHYAILGVPRTATPEQIKRAYRRLAMRWHPDRNDHPEATERFKEIRAAYDQLTASELAEEVISGEHPEAEAPEENVARAADIRLNLEISLEEAAAGCRKTIHYARGKACPTCQGSGEAGISRTTFCEACHGSGRVRDSQRSLQPCTACGGRGVFTLRTCRDCDGSGRETSDVSLKITVPLGMLPGDELRLAGQGEAASPDVLAGDLYLTLIIATHALYELRERDLHFAMPVSALAMLAGGDIELPSLSGIVKHSLEAGAVEIREVRLRGKGYPGRGKIPAGDLVVSLQPVFPQRLDAKQRKLLLQANAALMEKAADSLPEIDAWRRENGLG
ncbi:MAG: J domain-containing protein [Azonexus sp.]